MDQHPYWGLAALCLTFVTAAVVICLGINAWLLTEKARTAAVQRRMARAAEQVIAHPADMGPVQ